MSNKDLFKEAIADAKAVREAALANAKVALEEALAPTIQNMISTKLQEMDEELEEGKDDDDSLEEGLPSAFASAKTGDTRQDSDREKGYALEEDEDLEEDFDLSEILAELEEESLNEAKDEDDEEGGEDEEGGSGEEDELEAPEIEDAPAEDSGEKVGDLTADQLQDMIKDAVLAAMGNADMGGGDEMGMGSEEDVVAVDEEYGENGDGDDSDLEEINLEELLAELDALDEGDDTDNVYEAKKKEKNDKNKHQASKEEMEEALDTIQTLRNELNEVNLLNAKLLYVNKIFKAKNLNESQKLKVIAQFDKATTALEAKVIFESMSTAIEKSKKSTLKESIGFASKAAGVAPKKNIVEVDETMSRWQMLAGIRKF